MCINYSVKRFVAIIILYMIRKSNFKMWSPRPDSNRYASHLAVRFKRTVYRQISPLGEMLCTHNKELCMHSTTHIVIC